MVKTTILILQYKTCLGVIRLLKTLIAAVVVGISTHSSTLVTRLRSKTTGLTVLLPILLAFVRN